MKNSKKIFKCQVSNVEIKKILNLGKIPLVNRFTKTFSKKYNFSLNLCYSKKSKLFQINEIVNKKLLFSKNYSYTSSTTKILRENFKELGDKVKKKYHLKRNDLILDIGSNDGNLLSFFKNHCNVLGVTPENVAKIAIRRGIPTIQRYFDKSLVIEIKKKYKTPKIITATNVIAHIENPNELIKNIKYLLDNNSIFISESHYFVDVIRHNQFDSIYHEHLRYYTLASLNYLFKQHKLFIFDAEKISTHGGSIRVYSSIKKIKKSARLLKLIKDEKKIITKKNILLFKTNTKKIKSQFVELIKKLKKNRKTISCISSPSRSVTLLNYCNLNEKHFNKIYEISGSQKIGKLFPGTRIPIVNEKKIKFDKPDYLVILSWHISKELIKKIKKSTKAKFIIPLPKIKII